MPNGDSVLFPVLYNMLTAVEWLNPIVYLVGLIIATWAFMRCRKRGYLVVAIYFALVLFSLFAMPSINRAIRAGRAPKISEQYEKKLSEAFRQAADRVFEEEGRPELADERTVHFPFGPIVLVAGLWLLARHESRAQRSATV